MLEFRWLRKACNRMSVYTSGHWFKSPLATVRNHQNPMVGWWPMKWSGGREPPASPRPPTWTGPDMGAAFPCELWSPCSPLPSFLWEQWRSASSWGNPTSMLMGVIGQLLLPSGTLVHPSQQGQNRVCRGMHPASKTPCKQFSFIH